MEGTGALQGEAAMAGCNLFWGNYLFFTVWLVAGKKLRLALRCPQQALSLQSSDSNEAQARFFQKQSVSSLVHAPKCC